MKTTLICDFDAICERVSRFRPQGGSLSKTGGTTTARSPVAVDLRHEVMLSPKVKSARGRISLWKKPR